MKRVLIVVVLLAAVAMGAVGVREITRTPARDPLRLAVSPQIMSALVYVAAEKGFFQDEGLDVTLDTYPFGKDALAKVLNGEDDVATVAETPVMWSVLKGAHPTIFAAIEASDRDVSVVARTDAGVRMPADLAGKRIGMVPGTNHEYFLDLFLGVNKIAPASVTIVPVTMADGADALASGRIDALSSWVTARARLRAAIPDQIVIFPNDGIYLELWTLTARPEFLKARPETARRLLRALIAAERYTAAHRADAIAIVAPHIGLDTAAVERIWDDFGFNVSLDQSVVANLEGEARHEIKNRPGAAGPDFFKNISADALTAVDPGRVTIILP